MGHVVSGADPATESPGPLQSARDRHLPRRAAAVVSLAALALAGGCTSGKQSPGPPSGPAPTVAATTLPVATPTVPGPIANNVQFRKDVSLTACAAVTGGWSARGTAVAPGTKPATYKITVFFVTDPGDTVEGSALTTVSVPAGKSVSWVATGHFQPTATMQCVLRGVG